MARAVLRPLLVIGALLSGCATPLDTRPSFTIDTAAGTATVVARTTPFGMSDAAFVRLVRVGMADAAPEARIAPPAPPPYPTLRIVWHVSPMPERGVERLIANVFSGPRAILYQEALIETGAPVAVIESGIRSVSERLLASLAKHRDLSRARDTED